MRSLREKGKTIIFITHKLREVMEISDRVTVLRDGRVAGIVDTRATNTRELARMMVGREVLFHTERPKMSPGPEVLRVEDLHVRDRRGQRALRGLSLSVRRGEIVGVAGVDGNGQTELVEVLTGLRRSDAGEIRLEDRDMRHKGSKEFMAAGVAHIPEDRLLRGLILDFPLYENMLLGFEDSPPFAKGAFLNFKKVKDWAAGLVSVFDVRTPGVNVPAANLSGGNQQKVVLAREFAREPRLLIASQPTRGLDVGACEFVHQRIMNARTSGMAVLLVSLDLNEIMNLSDRILVIYEGRIIAEFLAGSATEAQIGFMMAGGGKAR
jgi:simple sugar transport system ATP-binding protein